MMRKAALFVVTLLAIGPWVSAEEFPLRLKTMTWEEATSCPDGGNNVLVDTKRPGLLKKEPPVISELPLYGVFGDHNVTSIVVRLDESLGKGKGYDRLLLDLNGNGDLTDDPVIKPSKEVPHYNRKTPTPVFGPIEGDIQYRKGIWRPSYYANLFDTMWSSGLFSPLHFWGQFIFRPACYLETTVNLGGIQQKIGLIDSNFNLRAGDRTVLRLPETNLDEHFWPRWERGDDILRDYNGSGSFEVSQTEEESEPLARIIYFGSSPYTMTLADDFKSVRFDSYTGPLARVAVTNAAMMVRLRLAWESSPGRFEYLGPDVKNGEVRVPPGTYCLYRCLLAQRDAQGVEHMALGQSRVTRLAKFTVTQDTPAVLRYGPPIEANVEVNVSRPSALGSARSRRSVGIRATFTGAGGEVYHLFTKGRDTPNQPVLVVQDAGGQEIARTDLGSGCPDCDPNGIWYGGWQVPNEFAAKDVRVFVEVMLGTIRIASKPVEVKL